MPDPRTPTFEAIRDICPPGVFNDPGNILAVNNILDALGAKRVDEIVVVGRTEAAAIVTGLTPRILIELLSHEAIVPECYKDSEGIWTWGVGVTNKSGHSVHPRYHDKPQPLEHCIGVYLWLLRNNYLPDVLAAFGDRPLTENELGAALSFHYNTGAIRSTKWVRMVLDGDTAAARTFLTTHYLNGGDLTERREKEAALFFDGKWSNDGRTMVYPVRKPSYAPHWSAGKRIDVRPMIEALLP